MFNSPINPLFGVSGVGQDGKQNHGGREEKQEKSSQGEKGIFEEEETLYSDISVEDFDVEKFVRRFFEGILASETSSKVVGKINDFLAKFSLADFERKYGKNLSKEDLSVILYGIAEKFGVSYN